MLEKFAYLSACQCKFEFSHSGLVKELKTQKSVFTKKFDDNIISSVI